MLYVSIIILLDGNLKADPSWSGIVFLPKNYLLLSFDDKPSPNLLLQHRAPDFVTSASCSRK